MTVLQRLVISLNDEPEAYLVLPPIDPRTEDKVMLFKVAKRTMPMPASTPAERRAFRNAPLAELPAPAHCVTNGTVSCQLAAPRSGVTHYHHRDLHDSLVEMSPERRLLELIDECVFGQEVAGGS